MEMIFTSKKFGKNFRPFYTEFQLVKEPPKRMKCYGSIPPGMQACSMEYHTGSHGSLLTSC
jgi:hypothetical protein